MQKELYSTELTFGECESQKISTNHVDELPDATESKKACAMPGITLPNAGVDGVVQAILEGVAVETRSPRSLAHFIR